MHRKFELAIEQLRQRADYKNQILDEKLNQLAGDLERREV